jgi:hypothetical protein
MQTNLNGLTRLAGKQRLKLEPTLRARALGSVLILNQPRPGRPHIQRRRYCGWLLPWPNSSLLYCTLLTLTAGAPCTDCWILSLVGSEGQEFPKILSALSQEQKNPWDQKQVNGPVFSPGPKVCRSAETTTRHVRNGPASADLQTICIATALTAVFSVWTGTRASISGAGIQIPNGCTAPS